jgi:hypothetical protein
VKTGLFNSLATMSGAIAVASILDVIFRGEDAAP